MQDCSLTSELQVVSSLDLAEIQLIPDAPPPDQEFASFDMEDLRQGDCYCLEMERLDGATAWSSRGGWETRADSQELDSRRSCSSVLVSAG